MIADVLRYNVLNKSALGRDMAKIQERIQMNNNDYREITEDDVTTVSTDQKEEMNGQESVNDTPDVSENEKETVQAEVTNSDASDEKEPEYEDICYICRRPEHIAGKMIKIPNNICICQDCMQKTFDSMNQTGFSMDDMLNMNIGKNAEYQHDQSLRSAGDAGIYSE